MNLLIPQALHRASIRTKLTVILLAISLTVVTIGFLIEVGWDVRDYRNVAEEKSREVVNVFAHDFTQILLLDSAHMAVETSARLREFDEVTHGYLFDAQGDVVYGYTREGRDVIDVPQRRSAAAQFSGEYLDVWAPVEYEGNRFGTVYLRFSLEKDKRELLEHLGVVGLILPAVFIIGLIMSFRSQGLFTKPILHLHEVVKKVGSTQDYSLRVYGQEHSEIGMLYRGFNQMLEKIEESNRKLQNTKLELRESNRQLSYLATHDALTGLINRAEFERRLKRALEEVQAGRRNHVLLYLDLDQFKVVNDTCGHMAGDELLRQITHLIRRHLAPDDALGRLGGDEFGVLLHDHGQREGFAKAKVLAGLVQDFRFVWEDKAFPLAVSVGVVALTPHYPDLTAVLSAADKACYVAKDSGRNRVQMYTEDDEKIKQHQGQMQWITRLRGALDEHRLALFWQPIVPTRRGVNEHRHYEVLLRMVDENGLLVTPEAFVPAAERFGLMPCLDRWVVDTVLRGFRDAPRLLDGIDIVSINLSGSSLGDEQFTRHLAQVFDDFGVPAKKICFEITETAAITNFSKTSAFMREMKRRGCLFALDDFGSGASSYAYLKRLPVDMIKIDGAFIKDILDDPIDAAMVRSINDIGHAMGLETIAEFVTSDAIFNKLVEIGVDYSQGFALAEPQPLPRGAFNPPPFVQNAKPRDNVTPTDSKG